MTDKNWLTKRLEILKKRKKDLAEALGMHPQHVNRLLLKIKLTPLQFSKLAQFLECNLEMLVQFWDNQIPAVALFKKNARPDPKWPTPTPTPPEGYPSPKEYYNTEEFAYILDQTDIWLVQHGKTSTTERKVRIAFSIYESIRSLEPHQKKAEILRLINLYFLENAI